MASNSLQMHVVVAGSCLLIRELLLNFVGMRRMRVALGPENVLDTRVMLTGSGFGRIRER